MRTYWILGVAGCLLVAACGSANSSVLDNNGSAFDASSGADASSLHPKDSGGSQKDSTTISLGNPDSGKGKDSGACASQVTCASAGAKCGTINNGCGGVSQCGGCPTGQSCGGGGRRTTVELHVFRRRARASATTAGPRATVAAASSIAGRARMPERAAVVASRANAALRSHAYPRRASRSASTAGCKGTVAAIRSIAERAAGPTRVEAAGCPASAALRRARRRPAHKSARRRAGLRPTAAAVS